MKLSELIAAYGDDEVQFQYLDQCTDSLNMKKGVTRVTFGTEQPINLDEPGDILIWTPDRRLCYCFCRRKAMRTALSREELEELDALAKTNDVVGKSFLSRHHWHESGYSKFARRGLVVWGEPPEGFNRRMFAGVEITAAGRKALATPRI